MRGPLANRLARAAVLTGCIALAATVGTAKGAKTPTESAGHFMIGLKRAELRDDWGRVWELLHPGQRKFIERPLFVRCMRTTRNFRPSSITVLAVANSPARVPGVSAGKVPASLVTLKVSYGLRAPSQTLKEAAVAFNGRWYWISKAASRKQFIRLNFCTQ